VFLSERAGADHRDPEQGLHWVDGSEAGRGHNAGGGGGSVCRVSCVVCRGERVGRACVVDIPSTFDLRPSTPDPRPTPPLAAGSRAG
jgi:hypothetical protein